MTGKICKLSLFSGILVAVVATPFVVHGAVKTSNRSYANAYNQINAMRYQQEYANATATNATTASATANLPVMVDDEELAEQILNNTSETTTMSMLESCSMIYPNGVFRWGIPESGVRRPQNATCIAVVDLKDANTGEVLATTTVAAGDSMKCNIDMFPESGMNASALSKAELPADVAPTLADVEAVMNEEQKQNAGLKIAAGAIIAGIAGNILAPKDAGDTKLFGTGKTQLIDTAVGAATGAGIMAASTYSGKVAGDTIKSTAVNAASGMVIGNMMAGAAGGNAVIATGKCKIQDGQTTVEYDCVAGKFGKTSQDSLSTSKYYITNRSGSSVLECDGFDNDVQKTPATSSNPAELRNCVAKSNIVKIIVTIDGAQKELTNLDETKFYELAKQGYTLKELGKYVKTTSGITQNDSFILFSKATLIDTGSMKNAYAILPYGSLINPVGYSKSDWDQKLNGKVLAYYTRKPDGTVGPILSDGPVTIASAEQKDNVSAESIYFQPSNRDASDGGLIDLSNQARAKGTLIGTAAGGAMGGFAGYQGAKSEITERWLTAIREYEDSLTNFVCTTGGRFVAKYNDDAGIPALRTSEE